MKNMLTQLYCYFRGIFFRYLSKLPLLVKKSNSISHKKTLVVIATITGLICGVICLYIAYQTYSLSIFLYGAGLIAMCLILGIQKMMK